MPLVIGSRLGPYEVIAPLGAGGMGEVYRARDPRLERDVAIKMLPADLAHEPERLARFSREARLLASLSHPGIAGILGLEEVGGTRYLVLELVEGETLAARLGRGALPVDEALEVCRQIAAGVEAAHEAGIVHRDLKPGNVMLRPDGTVKVLDFGLAKSGASDPAGSDPGLSTSPTMTHGATVAGVILGTAAYMSPEQARGRLVDKRTDVWSFGCVLYECLTARQAFQGETVSDTIASILKTEPDLRALPPGTPGRVRELLSRCLCKDARDRLRDIGEARVLLGAVSAGDDTPAAPAAPAGRGRSVPAWAAVASALVLAALAAVVAVSLAPKAGPLRVRKLDLVANDIKMDWFFAPQLSPDGRRVAYIAKDKVCVRDLAQLEPREVATVSGLSPLGWSADSRSLLYNDLHKLWKVSVEGGAPVALCEVPGTGSVIGITQSPGGVIAFSVWRGGVYQVPDEGGAPTLLFDIDPERMVDFHSPSWLANGDLLYVVHWKAGTDSAGQPRNWLAVYSGGKQLPVSGYEGGGNGAPIVTASGKLLFVRHDANAGLWAAPYDLRQRRISGRSVLVAAGAASVSAAADGSLLYMEGSETDGLNQMVWVDRAGKVLETAGVPHAGLARVALSPDGRRVAFTSTRAGNEDVWVHDLLRHVDTRLTFADTTETAPHWLSASRLSYVTRARMRFQVVAVNADGSGGLRVIAPPVGDGSQDALVAPGTRFALRILDDGGHRRLRVASVQDDGSLGPPQPFLRFQPDPDIGEACLSPDGRLLAFSTNDPGQPDVYVTRFPGGEGLWQVSSEGGRLPRWGRTSSELFYIAGAGPSRRALFSVAVDPSQDPPVGTSTHLFDIEPGWLRFGEMPYDVAADGKRFLMVRESSGDHPSRMVLVQNWEAEFAGKSGR